MRTVSVLRIRKEGMVSVTYSVFVIDDSVQRRQKCTIENNRYSYISNINIINHRTSTLGLLYNYHDTTLSSRSSLIMTRSQSR